MYYDEPDLTHDLFYCNDDIEVVDGQLSGQTCLVETPEAKYVCTTDNKIGTGISIVGVVFAAIALFGRKK